MTLEHCITRFRNGNSWIAGEEWHSLAIWSGLVATRYPASRGLTSSCCSSAWQYISPELGRLLQQAEWSQGIKYYAPTSLFNLRPYIEASNLVIAIDRLPLSAEIENQALTQQRPSKRPMHRRRTELAFTVS